MMDINLGKLSFLDQDHDTILAVNIENLKSQEKWGILYRNKWLLKKMLNNMETDITFETVPIKTTLENVPEFCINSSDDIQYMNIPLDLQYTYYVDLQTILSQVDNYVKSNEFAEKIFKNFDPNKYQYETKPIIKECANKNGTNQCFTVYFARRDHRKLHVNLKVNGAPRRVGTLNDIKKYFALNANVKYKFILHRLSLMHTGSNIYGGIFAEMVEINIDEENMDEEEKLLIEKNLKKI